MSNPFLKLIAVAKRYASRTVIRDLSLDIEEKEFVALLGSSGCGKTTLLRMIAGLETPDEGEIWIGGNRVATAGRNEVEPRRRGVGFVFQDLALWPHLTVAGNLDFVLASAKMPNRERADRIKETLRLMQVERFATSYPGKLSGGERQRVALARALVSRPRLLLLDEPMSSLDADLKSDLLQELTTLQNRVGVTAIYVTHDKAEAVAVARRIALMREGRIEKIEPVSALGSHQE